MQTIALKKLSKYIFFLILLCFARNSEAYNPVYVMDGLYNDTPVSYSYDSDSVSIDGDIIYVTILMQPPPTHKNYKREAVFSDILISQSRRSFLILKATQINNGKIIREEKDNKTLFHIRPGTFLDLLIQKINN